MMALLLLNVKSRRSPGCLVLTILLYCRHTNLRSAVRGGGKKKSVLLISLEDKVHTKMVIFYK